MPEEIKDANTEAASSAAVETETVKTDAKQAPETSTEAKEPQTLEEAVTQAVEAKREKTETETEEKAEEASTEAEPQKQDAEAEVPFHEHPRWQQVNKELQEAKPLAERAKKLDAYLQKSGLNEQQFTEMLEIGALMNSDPAAALSKLKPYVEALETHQGIRLPQDLKKKVDDGVIDEETAKEIAVLRSQKSVAEQRQKMSYEQKVQTDIANAINAWEDSMKKSDPDFQKKYDLLLDRFGRLQATPHERTPQAVLALVEQAYKEVNERIGGFIPRPPAKKVLTTNGASKLTKTEPETFEEAVATAGAKYRER